MDHSLVARSRACWIALDMMAKISGRRGGGGGGEKKLAYAGASRQHCRLDITTTLCVDARHFAFRFVTSPLTFDEL